MPYPDSHAHGEAIIIHDNETILYVTDSVLPFFNVNSRASLIGTVVRDHIAPQDYDALANQFD